MASSWNCRQADGDRELVFTKAPAAEAADHRSDTLIVERLVVCGQNPAVNGFVGGVGGKER